MTGPIRNLRVSVNILKDLHFMAKHTDQKSNELIIMKCYDPTCVYCAENPLKPSFALDLMKDRNFIWFNPLPSQKYPEHYMNFIEISKIDNEALPKGDTFLPYWIK